MKTEYAFATIIVALVFLLGFQAYSLMGFGTTNTQVMTAAVTASPVKLPANIQSSAPIQFKSFEEEVDYYKKNAKNPNNINIGQAVRNMDANLDGVCDTCGMAILHCIEQGMENM